jgi:hypothetical protein
VRRLVLVAAVFLGAASAAAAGGPVVPVPNTSWPGVAAGGVRYMAFPRAHTTTLKAVRTRDARVLARHTLRGRFGIPSPTFTSEDGLSADGRTLVVEQLDRSAIPRPSSRFVVLAANSLRVRRALLLRGDYAFDALSPDARLLYVTQRFDQLRYRIRVVDLATGRLRRASVADYRDGDSNMRGWPIARATRGGWAFTLYVGGTRTFVHALDTVHARAVCIFLPWHTAGTLYGGTLTVRGSLLHAKLTGTRFPPVAVDTRTLRVAG